MSQVAKSRTLWPLPGGSGRYLPTALAVLERVDESSRTEELLDWFCEQFSLDSRKTAHSYLRVLHTLGLVEVVGLSVYITPGGQEFLRTGDREVVRRALVDRISGVAELLDLLRRRPLRMGAAMASMREAGYDWSTASQIRYRLRWMEEVGLVERYGTTRPEYRITPSDTGPAR